MEEKAAVQQEDTQEGQEENSRQMLGLAGSWTFVPETGGFVKERGGCIPKPLADLYERQNSHTR